MNRILVTGNAGSGKSTLAKQLGDKLGIEVFGLDSVVWQNGWRKTGEQEKKEKIRKLANKTQWVIDGVSMDVFEKADTVIFLDFPLHVCYWRVFKRHFKYLFRSRPGLPDNCPEILIMKRQIQIMWKFDRVYKFNLLKAVNNNSDKKKMIHVQTESDLQYVRENEI